MAADSHLSSKWNLLPLALPWGLLIGGLFFTIVQSLNLSSPLGGERGWEVYRTLFSFDSYWLSLVFTFQMAITTAITATVLGFFIALLFSRLPPTWHRFTVVYKILLILPHISVAYLVLIIFSKTGLLSTLLFRLGLMRDYRSFPALIFDNGGIGIFLGYVIKETPFAILTTAAMLQTLDENYLITARMLGAGPLTVLRRVIVPHTAPAILSSFFILYLYAFGGFELPFILGGSKPVMMSISVYDILFRKDFIHRPEAMAILVTMLVVNLISILIFFRLQRVFCKKDTSQRFYP